MGYRAKQNVLSWGTPNGREISEEVLDILSHQGNANQNNLEIPPHTSQIGQDLKIRWQQMLERLQRKRNTSPLLVGLQTNTTTLEISLAILRKLDIVLLEDPAIPLLSIYLRDTLIHNKDICTTMFIAALFIIAQSWKEPRCPSED